MMKLLAETLASLVCLFFVIIVVIIAVNVDESKKWTDIFKGSGRDD